MHGKDTIAACLLMDKPEVGNLIQWSDMRQTKELFLLQQKKYSEESTLGREKELLMRCLFLW